MNDIKAIVADLEKLDRVATPAPWGAAQSLCCRDRGTVSVQETGHTQPSHAFSTWDADLVAAARNALPSLLAELHHLWVVEEAAVRYREASESATRRAPHDAHDAIVAESRSRKALFALLRAEVKP